MYMLALVLLQMSIFLLFFAVFLDLKKIEHKLNHHQQIGLK